MSTPDDPDIWVMLASIHSRQGNLEAFIECAKRALEINPKLLQIWLELGNIYSSRIGSPEAAEECFRNALKMNPHHLGAESGLVGTLRFQGKYDEALERIHSLLNRFPGNTSLIAGEADILEQMGNLEEAHERARHVIDRDQANSMALGVMLRLCKHFDCCDEPIRLVEKLISGHSLSSRDKKDLLFFLGKLHDQLGNYDRAFQCIQHANDLTEVVFDLDRHQQKFAAVKRVFSKQTLNKLPTARYRDTRPVFIIGMPRSGTSLTEQILASHPDVYGAGERNYINEIVAGISARTDNDEGYPECVTSLDQSGIDAFAKEYLEKIDHLSGSASRVTDKMPHNFMNLGLIALLFPGARIVHCKRDPRDTCLSIYFQNFGWLHSYATNLENLVQYYRLYLDIMRHWECVLELPIMTLHYEDLVTDQERVSRQLVDFLDLEWNDNCLQFHTLKRNVATVSYDQVRQPLYTNSLNRWKNYVSYITTLLDALNSVAPR